MAHRSATSTPRLICPSDRAELKPTYDGTSYDCGACERRYPVESGVVRFLPRDDVFYEDRYLGDDTVRWVPRRDRWPWSLPLWLMAAGYYWTVRRHAPAGSTLIEIGCGNGSRYFAQRYRAIGLDLSRRTLARVADLYATCLQADFTRGIPLPDASVDAVVSKFVWEHILPEDKPGVLAELRRVLRPGGKLVFLYDVDGRHPLYRRLQAADPARFREVVIEREGHQGWQNAADNAAAFEAAGLRVVEHRGKEKLLIDPAMYDKFQAWPGPLGTWSQRGLRFRFGRRFHLYNAATRALDESVGRWLPASWARVMVTVCERA
jgi:SAM-dependent methyltransferase